MTSLCRLVIVTISLCSLPAVATAQDTRRDQQKPPQAEGGQADRQGRQARPRSPEARKPREQPKTPRSREPELKRRKP